MRANGSIAATSGASSALKARPKPTVTLAFEAEVVGRVGEDVVAVTGVS